MYKRQWLDNLGSDPDFTGATASSIQRNVVSGAAGYTYDSSATLTDKALSGRYDQKASGS